MNIYSLWSDSGLQDELTQWVGDFHQLVLQLKDQNGSPVDITNGTLTCNYTDIASGSAYAFASGTATITKTFASQGIITLLAPAPYALSAKVRLTIRLTNGASVTGYGSLILDIRQP